MLEVQVHPEDIRQPVRYYFLTARTVTWIAVGAVVAGALLAGGVLLAPRGVEALLLRARTDQALRENRSQTDAIRRQAEQLRQLEQRVEAAAMIQSRLALVFGAAEAETFAGGRSGPVPGDSASPAAALELAGELHLATDRLLRSAASLGALVEEQRGLARIVPSLCPLPRDAFVLTSPFGNRRSPFTGQGDFHAGIDLAARTGVPVSAPADGRVEFEGRFPLARHVRWWRLGNVVVLHHGDRYITLFAHLKEVRVRRGQQVRRGDVIGTVGNTGWSTSPHLHYEVYRRGEVDGTPVPLDPRIFILDVDWQDREALLVASRRAPPPAFDPLPSLATGR